MGEKDREGVRAKDLRVIGSRLPYQQGNCTGPGKGKIRSRRLFIKYFTHLFLKRSKELGYQANSPPQIT
jgi:hypothetical protein